MMNTAAYQKLKDTHALPSPTGVAMEILRLAGDERTTLEQIAGVVQADPALSARLLTLVNSPFAGLGRKVAAVSVAVKMLGIRTVKNLALGLSLISSSRNGRCEAFDYDAFWSESLARAVAAKMLAARVKSFVDDEVFTLGLLSSIGQLALATVHPRAYGDLLSRTHGAQGTGSRDLERELFGLDAHELSAAMLADWGMPEIFCQAVRLQDEAASSDMDDAARPVLCRRLIRVSRSMAGMLTGRDASESSVRTMMAESAVMGIPHAEMVPLFDQIVEHWREAGTIFSVATNDDVSLDELRALAERSLSREDAAPEPVAGQDGAGSGGPPLHVLFVDDQPEMRQLAEAVLSSAGYRVTCVDDATSALDVERREAPQIIITDWVMPGIDGLDLCRRLRAREESASAYIIMLTARSGVGFEVEALDAGADDFISKSFSREELLAHVRAGERIVRLRARLMERGHEIARYNTRLAVANEKLRRLATTDELTGLVNRREMMARLREQWSLAERHQEPLCCILADIDHFKQFNDVHGHPVGDKVLQSVAATLRRSARAADVVSRMGGEEFLITCPRTTLPEAEAAAERIRAMVGTTVLQVDGSECVVTVSIGVAGRDSRMSDPTELLKSADAALYQAKKEGRNRVSVRDPAQPLHAGSAVVRQMHPDSAGARPAPSHSAVPLSVLLVDDDAWVRALCRRLLEREGYVVAEATDGATALRLASSDTPDIIVMDLMMSDMDGLECTRRLKASELTRETPILILSAAQGQSIEEALAAGADEFVAKPFRQREFILRMSSLARLRTSRTELLWSNQTRWDQARILQLLLQTARSLRQAASLDEILDIMASTAADLAHARTVSILLPSASGSELRVARCTAPATTPPGSAVALEGTIPGKVFRTGKAVVLPPEGTEGGVTHSEVCTPLLSGGDAVGVVYVSGRPDDRAFSGNEIDALDLLCHMGAAAVAAHQNPVQALQDRHAITI